jgi:soluble lytic murein transglycosylase-like protein
MISAIVAKYCALPVSLVMSVIHVESSGREKAFLREDRGYEFSSFGLMQVTYATAKFIKCGVTKPEQLFDPEKNVKCGCKYLSMQMDRYKNRRASIVSYNQGSVLIDGKPVLDHSGLSDKAMRGVMRNKYANKVLTHRKKICSEYGDCHLN